MCHCKDMDGKWLKVGLAVPCTAGQEAALSQKRLVVIASITLQNRWQNVWIGQQHGNGQGQSHILSCFTSNSAFISVHHWSCIVSFSCSQTDMDMNPSMCPDSRPKSNTKSAMPFVCS